MYEVLTMLSPASARLLMAKNCADRPDAVATAFERRNAVFEYGRRRIGQSRVDVAELLQSEPVGAFLRVRKDIRRGLVNGNGARTGRGVGRLSCVNLQGVEVIISFAHGFIFLIGL